MATGEEIKAGEVWEFRTSNETCFVGLALVDGSERLLVLETNHSELWPVGQVEGTTFDRNDRRLA